MIKDERRNPPGLRNMPIRFRCVYCEQLLGIARRKAGTVVKCPNCAGQLIVPPEDDANVGDREGQTAAVTAKESSGSRKPAKAAVGSPEPAGEGGLLFERSDFDDLLRPAIERHQPERPAPRPKPTPAEEPPIDLADASADVVLPSPASPFAAPIIAPKQAPPPRPGILLTPLRATLLCVVFVLAIAFAFGGGILLGMLLGK